MNRFKDESGALFIEATIVFPTMFFVIFILIFFGNAFYLRSCVDSIVTQEAIKGAAYCADPMLVEISENGSVPTTSKNLNVAPYSWIMGNSEAKSEIKRELDSRLSSVGSGFFSGMAPNTSKKTVKYKTYLVVSSFEVSVDYTIRLPIRFLWSDEPIALEIQSTCSKPVNDAPDFIRNVDMAVDYYQGSKVEQWVEKCKSNVSEFLGKFGGK